MNEKQAGEYIKCRTSPIYFIKTYCKIRHPTKGLLPFALWDFQEDTIRAFLENSYNIILKARQLGISTVCAAYVAWLITFFSDKEVYILATKQKTAINLVAKVTTIVENLPAWLAPVSTILNKQSIELTNGSKVQASGTTPDAARSEALSLLIVDEAAFIRGMDEIWISSQPTLATGGDCIALSSPNGMGNWFHKYYQKAEMGEEVEVGGKMIGFKPIKLHWSLHPDRDDHWAENERKKLGPRAFAQEYDCDFLQSGSNVIDFEDINWYTQNPEPGGKYDLTECPYIREPAEKGWMDRNLWIWKYEDLSKNYIIAADTARGDGEDYSGFHVICVDDYEQVAEYRGRIPPNIFGQLVVSTAVRYNNAYLAVENTGIGHSTCQTILELDYNNLWWSSKEATRIHQENADKFFMNPYDVPRNAVAGFTMSSRTRPIVIARLEEDIRTKSIIIHSRRLFEECTTFVFENGKPQAMPGFNDDLIMALGIGAFVRHASLNIFGYNNEMNKALLDNMSYKNSPYEYSILKSDDKRHEKEYKFDLGVQNEQEDLRWLL